MTALSNVSGLDDKILGCLAGSALGDAIGGATEMMSYQKK
jgi:ADP-ribosylglycohydrolase